MSTFGGARVTALLSMDARRPADIKLKGLFSSNAFENFGGLFFMYFYIRNVDCPAMKR